MVLAGVCVFRYHDLWMMDVPVPFTYALREAPGLGGNQDLAWVASQRDEDDDEDDDEETLSRFNHAICDIESPPAQPVGAQPHPRP